MSFARFILRFIGLTSLVAAAGAALVLVGLVEVWDVDYLRAAGEGRHGEFLKIAIYVFGGGVLLALVIGVIDLVYGIWSAAGRRSLLGTNVIVQVALAIILLGGINAWSFKHYLRWDLTRDKVFTINPDVVSQMKKLSGETTVVVYRQENSNSSQKPDDYDTSAEARISDKVQDLVEQLREFGRQFNVIVLDPHDKDFRSTRSSAVKSFPELDAAIKTAPDSSIFFCDNDQHVQRMSFNEFYLLDKSASLKADGGRGNLVLLSQGIEPFARHVLAIEEKKPRIGVAVIHELLTTRSTAGGLTLSGMGQSLEANGFQVRDIVLKRWNEESGPEPGAYTVDESRLDRLEATLSFLNRTIPDEKSERDECQSIIKALKEGSLDELNRRFQAQLRGRSMTEEDRTTNLEHFESVLSSLNEDLTQLEEARSKSEKDLSGLLQRETVVEGRRVTDVGARSRQLFDDCDLLIIPRMTLIDFINGWRISPRFYKLADPQIEAIRAYLRAGKPILVLSGPTNEPARAANLDSSGQDGLEALLGELGVIFGDQVILVNDETRALSEKGVNPLGGEKAAEIPPLDFDLSVGRGFGLGRLPVNPLRKSLHLIAQSVGGKMDLVMADPRPIYFASTHERPPYNPEFLFTDPTSFNSKKPFPEGEYVPRYTPDKLTDPTKGTLNEERRGSFPVGVAFETQVPPEWMDERYRAMKVASLVMDGAQPVFNPALLGWGAVSSAVPYTTTQTTYSPKRVRVAVIGKGGVFASPDAKKPDLTPATEQLLLQTVNWLLGREDRLPRADRTWQYPRVDMSASAKNWWTGGAIIGIPLIFVYLGVLVVMVRRMR